MPVMDGLTFLQKKWEIAYIRDIPTVVMTAEEDKNLLQLGASAIDILKKPLNIKSILAAVGRNLPADQRTTSTAPGLQFC